MNGPNEYGEVPGDICCQRSAGGKCFEHSGDESIASLYGMPAWTRYQVIKGDERLDTHAHLPFLKSVAKGNVLEIGVHCGISTTALLAGLEENGGHLWSVDVHPSCRYVWYGHPQWTFCCPWSGDRVEVPMLDLVFIDGDHSFDAVLTDLRYTFPNVKKGGMILLHDADTPSFPGVRQAIDLFCETITCKHELRKGSHGLEVIYV